MRMFVGCLLVLIVGVPCVGSAQDFVVAEGFEDDTVGELPAGWTGGGQVTDQVSWEGTQSFQPAGSLMNLPGCPPDTVHEGVWRLSGRVMVESCPVAGEFPGIYPLQLINRVPYTSQYNGRTTTFGFGSTGYFVYATTEWSPGWHTHSYNTGVQWHPGIWYGIETTLDLSGEIYPLPKFSVRVTDESGAEVLYLPPVTISGYIWRWVLPSTIRSYSTVGATYYVDAINMRRTDLDGDPPVITATADRTELWPPNHKAVTVNVAGTIEDASDIFDAWLQVEDEYGELDATIGMTLADDGSYTVPVDLIAWRNGRDRDGRTYTLTVWAMDVHTNLGASEPVTVLVPHDRGKKGEK